MYEKLLPVSVCWILSFFGMISMYSCIIHYSADGFCGLSSKDTGKNKCLFSWYSHYMIDLTKVDSTYRFAAGQPSRYYNHSESAHFSWPFVAWIIISITWQSGNSWSLVPWTVTALRWSTVINAESVDGRNYTWRSEPRSERFGVRGLSLRVRLVFWEYVLLSVLLWQQWGWWLIIAAHVCDWT